MSWNVIKALKDDFKEYKDEKEKAAKKAETRYMGNGQTHHGFPLRPFRPKPQDGSVPPRNIFDHYVKVIIKFDLLVKNNT